MLNVTMTFYDVKLTVSGMERARRRSLQSHLRASQPVSTQSMQTILKSQEVEANILKLKEKITTLEKQIAEVQQENELLKNTPNVVEEVDDGVDYASEIDQKRAQLDEIQREITANTRQIEKVKSEITAKQQEFTSLIMTRTKHGELRQTLASAEAQLRDRRKRMQDILNNLLTINSKRESLDGYEWMEQKPEVQAGINQLKKQIAAARKESEQLRQRLTDAKSQREGLIPIYEKWRGRVVPNLETANLTIDSLVKELEKQSGKRQGDYERLQKEIEANEELRELIQKERRENMSKVRKMQKTVAEMEKQTTEMYEMAALEEQRMIQRIIAARDV